MTCVLRVDLQKFVRMCHDLRHVLRRDRLDVPFVEDLFDARPQACLRPLHGKVLFKQFCAIRARPALNSLTVRKLDGLAARLLGD